jgi:hypothetical protein
MLVRYGSFQNPYGTKPQSGKAFETDPSRPSGMPEGVEAYVRRNFVLPERGFYHEPGKIDPSKPHGLPPDLATIAKYHVHKEREKPAKQERQTQTPNNPFFKKP